MILYQSTPPVQASDSIETLGLAEQVCNVLRAAGIFNIQELVSNTEQQLLKTPGLGRRSVKQIRERLVSSGIELRSVFIRKGVLRRWNAEPTSDQIKV